MKQHVLPYHYYVQDDLVNFWKKLGTENRNVLFIFGLGFDPRCVPALRNIAIIFKKGAKVKTCCARFTNLFDEQLDENRKNTQDCLSSIRYITDSMSNANFQHTEIEVNMFSLDRKLIGEKLLIDEFEECYANDLSSFTDIIVDISTFPRSLMYALIGYLWKKREENQNLFAVLTEVPSTTIIEESDYTTPSYIFEDVKSSENKHVIWIPVLGGRIERFEHIHNFLNPADIFPIIPFSSTNPRAGDEILLASKIPLFEKWGVPFSNVMYASGDVPFDVFRKILDIVQEQGSLSADISVVVSALSGRSLSLGVLLAALRSNLAICHAQPITYNISSQDRDKIKLDCESAVPTIYWLDGQLYETSIK